MKLTTMALGLGVMAAAAGGVLAAVGVGTGTLEIADDEIAQLIDEVIREGWDATVTSDASDPTNKGILAQWFAGIPFHWVFALILLVRYAHPLGHILTTWSDEGREWVRVQRERPQTYTTIDNQRQASRSQDAA